MSRSRNLRVRRRGAVIVAVLVCCIVGVSLACTSLSQAVRSRRETRERIQRDQTRLLVDAGARFAKASVDLAQLPTGEQLELDAHSAYPDAQTATLTLNRIEQDSSESTGELRILVTATLASAGEQPFVTRLSREITLDGRAETEGGNSPDPDESTAEENTLE